MVLLRVVSGLQNIQAAMVVLLLATYVLQAAVVALALQVVLVEMVVLPLEAAEAEAAAELEQVAQRQVLCRVAERVEMAEQVLMQLLAVQEERARARLALLQQRGLALADLGVVVEVEEARQEAPLGLEVMAVLVKNGIARTEQAAEAEAEMERIVVVVRKAELAEDTEAEAEGLAEVLVLHQNLLVQGRKALSSSNTLRRTLLK